jgi:hypothetical protein
MVMACEMLVTRDGGVADDDALDLAGAGVPFLDSFDHAKDRRRHCRQVDHRLLDVSTE